MSESSPSAEVTANQSVLEESDKQESNSSGSGDESEASSYSTCSVRSESSGSANSESNSASHSTTSNEHVEPNEESATSNEEVENEEDVALTKQSLNKTTGKLPVASTPKKEIVSAKKEIVSAVVESDPVNDEPSDQEANEAVDKSPVVITPAKDMASGDESPVNVTTAASKPLQPALPVPAEELDDSNAQPKATTTHPVVKKSTTSGQSKGEVKPPKAADTGKTPSKTPGKPHKKSKKTKESTEPKQAKEAKVGSEAASSSSKHSHKHRSKTDVKDKGKTPVEVIKVKKEPTNTATKEAKKRGIQEVKDKKTTVTTKVKKAKHAKPQSSSGSASSESSAEEPVAALPFVAPVRISKISEARRNQQAAMSKAKNEGMIRDMELQAAEVTDALKIIDSTKFVFRPTHASPQFHHVTGTGLPHIKQHILALQERYGPLIKSTAKVNLIVTRDANQAKKALLGPGLSSKFAPRFEFDNDLKRATSSSTQAMQIDNSASAEELVVEFKDIPAASDEPSTSSKHRDQSIHGGSTDQAKSSKGASATKKHTKHKKESRSKKE